MGRPYVPMNESGSFIQDAVDAIEFANGPIHSSKFGALRAQMGHKQPFGLNRFEIGNEESDMEQYSLHFQACSAVLVI